VYGPIGESPNQLAVLSVKRLPAAPSGGLIVQSLDFDCHTGRLSLTASSNEPGPIEFRIPGHSDWSTQATFSVPPAVRTEAEFRIDIRQGNRLIQQRLCARCSRSGRNSGNPEDRVSARLLIDPAGEQVQVELSGAAGETIRYQLQNGTGQRISNREVMGQGNLHLETIYLSGEEGIYLLTVKTRHFAHTFKVAKTRVKPDAWQSARETDPSEGLRQTL